MPSRPLASGNLAARDATYAPTDDLPEAGAPEPPAEAPSTEAAPTVAAPAAPQSNTGLVVARILGVRPEASPPEAVADNAAH